MNITIYAVATYDDGGLDVSATIDPAAANKHVREVVWAYVESWPEDAEDTSPKVRETYSECARITGDPNSTADEMIDAWNDWKSAVESAGGWGRDMCSDRIEYQETTVAA